MWRPPTVRCMPRLTAVHGAAGNAVTPSSGVLAQQEVQRSDERRLQPPGAIAVRFGKPREQEPC